MRKRIVQNRVEEFKVSGDVKNNDLKLWDEYYSKKTALEPVTSCFDFMTWFL